MGPNKDSSFFRIINIALYRNLKGGRAYERKDYRSIKTGRFSNINGSIYGICTMVDCRFRNIHVQFIYLKSGPTWALLFAPHLLHGI